MIPLREIVLTDDWNAAFDPQANWSADRKGTYIALHIKILPEIVVKLVLIDKFKNWAWETGKMNFDR